MRKNQRNFSNVFEACEQAFALSQCIVGGSWKVYKKDNDKYVVVADDFCDFDATTDDFIYQAKSNCNSGACTYAQCRELAEEEIRLRSNNYSDTDFLR